MQAQQLQSRLALLDTGKQRQLVDMSQQEVNRAQERLRAIEQQSSPISIAALEQEVATHRRELNDYDARLASLHAELQAAEQQFRRTQAEINDMEARLRDGEQAWRLQSPRYMRLRQALEQLTRDIDRLEQKTGNGPPPPPTTRPESTP